MSGPEKLPDLASFLGLEEKAQEDYARIKTMSRNLFTIDRIQQIEGLKDDDAIPGFAPEPDGEVEKNGQKFRSFTQQRALINRSFAQLWSQIEEEGYRANVERLLHSQNGSA